jgi:hypothetical protein
MEIGSKNLHMYEFQNWYYDSNANSYVYIVCSHDNIHVKMLKCEMLLALNPKPNTNTNIFSTSYVTLDFICCMSCVITLGVKVW